MQLCQLIVAEDLDPFGSQKLFAGTNTGFPKSGVKATKLFHFTGVTTLSSKPSPYNNAYKIFIIQSKHLSSHLLSATCILLKTKAVRRNNYVKNCLSFLGGGCQIFFQFSSPLQFPSLQPARAYPPYKYSKRLKKKIIISWSFKKNTKSQV